MSVFGEPLVLLIIVIALGSILYYYRNTIMFRQRLRQVEVPRERQERPDRPTIECPKCGRPMQDGYLLGPGGLYWSQVAPIYQDIVGLPWARRGFGAPMGSEPLGASMFRGIGRQPQLKAYRCSSCNLVYIDLQNQMVGD